MSALVLRNRFQGNTTLVENEFIDNYMAAANGVISAIHAKSGNWEFLHS